MGPRTIRRVVLGALLIAAVASPEKTRAATVSVVGDGLELPIGATMNVEIAIDSAAGVEAAYFRIVFNGQRVAAGSVSADAATSACLTEFNTGVANEVRIAMACAQALADGGALYRIGFEGLSSGATALTLQECLLNEGVPSCTAVNGSITVSSCILDVDGSGAPFDVATDVTYVARRILHLAPVPPSFRQSDPGIPADSLIAARVDPAVSSLKLDVDGNGVVDPATDLIYIARHALGFQEVVPASFRLLDPTIASNAVIAANVAALCP
jgi:hypothetical protein